MKRSPFDALRRGFENMLANWPLIIIRLAEGALLVGIVFASILAAVVPLFVSAGLTKTFDPADANSAAEFFALLFIEHWGLVLYLLMLMFVILGVLVAIHSFVEAGSAQVYIDGERRAARFPVAARSDFATFAADRWLAGGRKGWWRVFWIYNLAWSVGAVIVLVPLLFTLAAMLMAREVPARLAFGCLGIVVAVMLMIPTGIVIGMWTQKAIIVCVARATDASASLREGWRAIRLDFGRHLAVAIILMMVSFAVAMVVSGMSFPLSLGGGNRNMALLPLLFAPAQIAMSFVQSALSAAVGAWFLASFVALTEEK